MQPTYLPWAGYFNLIAQVDVFVFLDDVQFERQSWQTRNRILLQGREHLLVVPAARLSLGTRIDQARVAEDPRWRSDHWKTLAAAYGKAPFGAQTLDLLRPFYEGPAPSLLAEFNEGLVSAIAGAIGLDTRTVRASSLGCGGKRSDHVAQICAAIGCDEYLSPQGAREYLEQDGFPGNSGVRLLFQRFDPAPYAQRGAREFVPRLSLVDLLANLGSAATLRYVRENGELEVLPN
jgi:hypothetical protein